MVWLVVGARRCRNEDLRQLGRVEAQLWSWAKQDRSGWCIFGLEVGSSDGLMGRRGVLLLAGF